eukprot:2689523-Alexandrium_andersonii.AAC.1
MVREAIGARSRPPRHVEVGARVYFYRGDADKKRRAGESDYLGPAVVFGENGKNLWLQYGT